MKIKNLIDWKLFLVMLAGASASVIAVFPLLITTQGEALRELPLPLPVVLLASTIQSVVLISIALFVGLRLGKNVGLETPILSDWLAKRPFKTRLKRVAKLSSIFGIFVGVAIIMADKIFSFFFQPTSTVSIIPWQGFLGSFYGGIVEEILMRFFLMTLLVWIFCKIRKRKGVPSSLSMWSAISIASVVFGFGHLPATTLIYTVTPLVVARAIILNSIGGLCLVGFFGKRVLNQR